MSDDENPPCERCGGATEYSGLVSLPPKLIYKCAVCGFHTWIDGSPKLRVQRDQPSVQQRQQQQQQPQVKPKDEE